jgi:flavin-dependent dehydrogenase
LSVNGRRVLISGASVAGPVLAYWLNRFGIQPIVVEKTEELRFGSGGHAVDLFDPALQIIEWMGALPQVQDAGTHTEIISFIREGHRPIDVPAALGSEGVSARHVEIMRGELAKIIYEACRNDVEYLFGNSISSLAEIDQRVDVTFRHGSPQTFDLAGGRSCQAVVWACVVGPRCAGFWHVWPAVERIGVPGAHADSMRPRDHDHGSVGVVRAAVVAKGRPPS